MIMDDAITHKSQKEIINNSPRIESLEKGKLVEHVLVQGVSSSGLLE